MSDIPQHTFGGSRLDRYTTDFETVLGDEGGLAAAAPAAPAEPAAAPAAPAAPSWGGPSQQEWEASQAFQRALLDAINEPDEPIAPATPAAELTPQQIAEKMLEEKVGPYMPILDQIAEEKGREIVSAHIEKLKTDDPEIAALGDFDTKRAVAMSQAFLAQGMDAASAIRAAALEIGSYAKEIREQSGAAETQQIQNRVDQPPQAPAAPAAVTQNEPTQTGRDRYEARAQAWLESRHGVGTPTG